MAHVIDYIEFTVDDVEQSKAFYAKALGVSPVRVALVDSSAESSTVPLQEGKGIVRVR